MSQIPHYVRLESGQARPMPLFTDGVCNLLPGRAQWRRDNGYYPYEPAPPPDCDGDHRVLRAGWAYDSDGAPAKVVPVYEIVPKTRRAGGPA